MSSKIFNSIWIVAITVFLASLLFIMCFSYSYFTHLQKSQLKNETELAAQGAELSGEAFFNTLPAEDYRITWIAADGSVLYDNEADKAMMENHLEREEVKQAIEEGYGESARYSSSLAIKQLYAAKSLSDGTVVRLSIAQMAIWTLFIGFAQPICIVILIALALSFFIASKVSKAIVKPINAIDPDHPEDYYDREEYKEVEPLLRRISSQQAEIKKDREQIEKTALIRQEFTANVSHELKTPLHAISGYAELLENGMVKSEDVKPFLGKIRSEAMRITKLVEDIIDLTKLDNGNEEEKLDCELYRIAENAVDSLEVAASAQNINLVIEGSDVHVQGIPQMLYSIIYNICDNAIKYNKMGGSVNVSITEKNNNAVIVVKDTGIGIPEDSLCHIFERFYRVDKSRSKEVGGTGLGLSIVKHAVKLHGGQIEVNSKLGEGTEFTVVLPKA